MRNKHRQFVAVNINNLNHVNFDEKTFHHIINVLRYKENDFIISLFEGKKYFTKILLMNKQYSFIALQKIEENKTDNTKIHLFNAMIKPANLDLIIEKTTEIGIDKIFLFSSQQSIDMEESKFVQKCHRWNKIIQNSIEQSRSDKKTVLFFKVLKFVELIEKLKEYKLVLIANENETNFYLHNIFKNQLIFNEIAIVVGPEKGWTQKELEIFAINNFYSISLSKNTLKAETASIYFASLINYLVNINDMQKN